MFEYVIKGTQNEDEIDSKKELKLSSKEFTIDNPEINNNKSQKSQPGKIKYQNNDRNHNNYNNHTSNKHDKKDDQIRTNQQGRLEDTKESNSNYYRGQTDNKGYSDKQNKKNYDTKSYERNNNTYNRNYKNQANNTQGNRYDKSAQEYQKEKQPKQKQKEEQKVVELSETKNEDFIEDKYLLFEILVTLQFEINLVIKTLKFNICFKELLL